MGSRGTLDRSCFRRAARPRYTKSKTARRPFPLATSLNRAQPESLDDTSDARIVRIDSPAIAPDRKTVNESQMQTGDADDFYLLIIDIGGEAKTEIPGPSVAASSEIADAACEGPTADLAKSAVAQRLSLKLNREALEARLVDLTRGSLGAPLVFEPQLFRSPESRSLVDDQLRRLLRCLKDGDGPEIIAGLEDALITALLTCCKHSYSPRFQDDAAAKPPHHVKLVEDYILKNAEKPISMKDLEVIAEVSARSIHYAFRRFRGYSPKALLQAVRLGRARETLLAAEPGDRVMTIATRCGFAHLGRFSAAYKRRFGELPSETLGRK